MNMHVFEMWEKAGANPHKHRMGRELNHSSQESQNKDSSPHCTLQLLNILVFGYHTEKYIEQFIYLDKIRLKKMTHFAWFEKIMNIEERKKTDFTY